jgi:hypothetical protein
MLWKGNVFGGVCVALQRHAIKTVNSCAGKTVVIVSIVELCLIIVIVIPSSARTATRVVI